MKKSIYILACAGLMAVSCGEELLETRSSSSSDSETMFSNETYAEAAVMNIYRQFGVDKSYRNRWLVYYGANTDSEWYVSASPDKPTDTKTLIYTYNPTYDDAGSQLNESSGQFALMYTAIENANLAIAGLRKYGSVETDAGMRYLLGESLVLRAFFYFDLIKAWGDVPMRFQPIGETGDVNKPRSDRDEIYKQIIADLEEAVDYVDWPGEGVRTGTVTRVNKAFAYGLLARVCLSAAGYAQRPDEGRIGTGDIGSNRRSKLVEAGQEWGDNILYTKALDACKAVIAKENVCVKLEGSFEEIWRDMMKRQVSAGGETLFVIPFADNRGQWMNNYAIRHATADKYCGKAGAGGTIGPVPTLFYEYDKADRRRDVTCIPYRWNGGKQELENVQKWYCGKYRYEWMNDVISGNDCGIKPILMRYADVLLMAAEAANELNDLPYAKEQLRKVRYRAFKSNEAVDKYLEGIGSKGAMFKAIYRERMLEFSCEQIRKQDLIRWGLLKKSLDDVKGKMKAMLDHTTYTSAVTGDSYDFSTIGTKVYYKYDADGETIQLHGLDFGEAGEPDGEGWTLYTSKKTDGTLEEEYIKNGTTSTGRIDMIFQYDPDVHMFWPIFKQSITTNSLLANDYGYPVR